MKAFTTFFITLITVLLGNAEIHDTQSIKMQKIADPCPPYHTEIKETLKNFLSSENNQEKRKKLGINNLSSEDVVFLKNKTNKIVCKQLKNEYPWPLENHLRGYYKSKNYYFVVDAIKPVNPDDGEKINLYTGYSVIKILNKELELVDSVSM